MWHFDKRIYYWILYQYNYSGQFVANNYNYMYYDVIVCSYLYKSSFKVSEISKGNMKKISQTTLYFTVIRGSYFKNYYSLKKSWYICTCTLLADTFMAFMIFMTKRSLIIDFWQLPPLFTLDTLLIFLPLSMLR